MVRGELPVGSQVPTEQALCESFKVSRITARKALQILQAEGIIARVRGRGSFIQKLPEESQLISRSSGREAAEIGFAIAVASGEVHEENSWSHGIMRSMESVLLEGKYNVLPISYDYHSEKSTQQVLSRIDSDPGRFTAIVLFGGHHEPKLFAALDKRGIPWVTINQNSKLQTHNFVAADNYGGGCRVGRIFAANGYSSTLIFGPDIEMGISVSDRFFGFLHGYMAGGQSLARVKYFATQESAPSPEEYAELLKRLSKTDRPRAVFCHGDILAASMLRAAAQLGLKVPGDLAVMGATGLKIAEQTSPPLSVLSQSVAAFGKEVASLVLELISGGRGKVPGRFVSCELIERESCPVLGEGIQK